MIVSDNGIVGMVLSEDNKTTLFFVQSSKNNKIVWEKAEFTNANVLIRSKSYSNKFIFNKEKLNNIIGFMAWVENQNEYVFKIRDCSSQIGGHGVTITRIRLMGIWVIWICCRTVF